MAPPDEEGLVLTTHKTSNVAGLGTAIALLVTTAVMPSSTSAQPAHRCAGPALEQARKLLVFHVGPDDRIEIDKSVKTVAPIRNPSNRAQRFDVLEVWGHIYKGDYRMRFIYAQTQKECVLMGQEILEYASL